MVSSPSENCLWLARELSELSRAPLHIDPDLAPRSSADMLGRQWGSSAASLATPGISAVEPIEACHARVLAGLGRLAANFPQQEVIVVLHVDGLRAALATALKVRDANSFDPEPMQTIALDWPHPEAREFVHAVVGMGLDWCVGPVATKVHRFPGGASVLPRSS